jgi:hypothetical protein
MRASETQMYRYQNEDKFRDPEKFPLGKSGSYNANSFSRLQHRLDATRRARFRNLQALGELKAAAQAEAAAAPAPVEEPAGPPSLTHSPETTSLQIGFVPTTPVADPPQPAPVASIVPADVKVPQGLTRRGIIAVDGVLQPVPAGGRSFESFPVDR